MTHMNSQDLPGYDYIGHISAKYSGRQQDINATSVKYVRTVIPPLLD